MADREAILRTNLVGLQHRQSGSGKSFRELFAEGATLQHCVASYIGRCVQGLCSIWTMECLTDDCGIEKLLTIEVQADGKVAQVRGQANRLPTEAEEKVLRVWFGRAGLR